MSRCLHQTLILIGLLGTSWGALAQTDEVTSASAPKLCSTNPAGGSSVLPDLIALSPADQNATEQIEAALKDISSAALDLEKSVLQRAQIDATQTQSQLGALKKKWRATGAQLLAWLSQLDSSRRVAATTGLDQLFLAAQALATVESYLSPQKMNLAYLKSEYSLQLSAAVSEKFFPIGREFIHGLDKSVDRVISLNAETRYGILVRSAALSPFQGTLAKAYVDTARCALTRMHLAKLQLHQQMIGRKGGYVEQSLQQLACLNGTVKDLLEVTSVESNLSQEAELRTELFKQWPSLRRYEARPFIKKIFQYKLIGAIPQLYSYPQFVINLNESRQVSKSGPEVPRQELDQINGELNQVIEEEFRRHQALGSIRHFWSFDLALPLIKLLKSECQYEISGERNARLSDEDIVRILNRSEDVYFYFSLVTAPSRLNARLANATQSERISILKLYLREAKLQSARMALFDMLVTFDDNKTPDAESVLIAIARRIDNLFEKQFQEKTQRGELDAWLAQITQALTQQEGRPSDTYLLSYTENQIKAAKEVAAIFDPLRNPEDLKFSDSAVLEAMNRELVRVAPANKARMDILADETNFTQRKVIWSQIQKKISQDAANAKVTCTPFSTSQKVVNWTKSLFRSQIEGPANSVQSDCRMMNLAALALQLDKEAPDAKMATSLRAIRGLMDESEYKSFIEKYRQALANQIYEHYRLLGAKIDPAKKDSEYYYQALARASAPESVLPLVRRGIEQSIPVLEQNLYKVLQAQSVSDLSFFATRSKVINTIFGEGDISKVILGMNSDEALKVAAVDLFKAPGFVFPRLIQFQRELQQKSEIQEEMTQLIWNDFMQANGVIALGVLAGWATKTVGAMGPRTALIPSISSGVDRIADRAGFLLSGHAWFFTSLLITDIAYLESLKSDYLAGERQVEALMRSDLAELDDRVNPIPLIEWKDYIKQKFYFQTSYEEAVSNQKQSAFWAALPAAFIAAGYLGPKLSAGYNKWLNSRYTTRSLSDRGLYAMKWRFSIRHKLNLLNNDLRRLGNPTSLDIAELQMRLHSKVRSAPNAIAEAKLNESYFRIVTGLGEQMNGIRGSPQLMETYARVLFGPQGSMRQIERFLDEYDRLLRGVL